MDNAESRLSVAGYKVRKRLNIVRRSAGGGRDFHKPSRMPSYRRGGLKQKVIDVYL